MFSFARTAAVAACVVGYFAVAADDAYSAAPPTKNIVQLAQSVPDLSILVELVVAGGLVDTLSGAGPFTVFAPGPWATRRCRSFWTPRSRPCWTRS
jgi:hypothetical protein